MLARSVQARPVVVAQLFSQPAQVTIPAGSMVPVSYDEAEKIVVLPDETAPVTLMVAADMTSERGTVLIPQGSGIEGELRPVYAEDDDEDPVGTQFFAETLVFPSGVQQPIDAVSDVLTETETITRRSDPDILRGAAIGAAAAAVLSEVLGDIDFIEVLAGAGLGALASVLLRGREEVDVVVIYPETDLDLTLQSDFILGSQD
jgi:hypothetical protein